MRLKNTGNARYTIINQDLICNEWVDTIRPDSAPEWRAWDTPIHEFGHAIELALGLRSETIQAFSDNGYHNTSVQSEYFAWTTESWFDAHIRFGDDYSFRNRMAEFKQNYFSSIFEKDEVWKPTCEGRPPFVAE